MAEWVYDNPNPRNRRTDDCVVRAVSIASGQTWDETYAGVALTGLALSDMPNMNHVWRFYLRGLGFKRKEIQDTCPDCYTVNDFADEHPHGRYVLGTGTHAVAVVDGRVMDTFDSRELIPMYYYYLEEDQYA